MLLARSRKAITTSSLLAAHLLESLRLLLLHVPTRK
jgi:hypothetical protein